MKIKYQKISYIYIIANFFLLFVGCARKKEIKLNLPPINLNLDPTRANVSDSFKSLISTLDSVFYRDTKFRRFDQNNPKSYVYMTKQFNQNSLEVKRLDSLNQIIVDSIIQQYGEIVSYKKIGYSAHITIMNVIQHANLTYQLKYDEYIEMAMKENKTYFANYTLFKDRLLMYQKKKQIYGTQVLYSKKLKKSVLFPVQDIDRIDSVRNQGGLKQIMPLKDYLKMLNITWDKNQYIKDLPTLIEEFKIVD